MALPLIEKTDVFSIIKNACLTYDENGCKQYILSFYEEDEYDDRYEIHYTEMFEYICMKSKQWSDLFSNVVNNTEIKHHISDQNKKNNKINSYIFCEEDDLNQKTKHTTLFRQYKYNDEIVYRFIMNVYYDVEEYRRSAEVSMNIPFYVNNEMDCVFVDYSNQKDDIYYYNHR
jgi:hypothetical protein